MSTTVKPKLRYGIHRKQSMDSIDVGTEVKFLSPFQIKKLTVFFEKFFDHDLDGSIRRDDIEDLTERVRKYMAWETDNPHHIATVDLYNIFFSCLKEQVSMEMGQGKLDIVDNVSKMQWLNMWGRLIKEATSITSFPSWVQLLPKNFFSIMDKEQRGYVTKDDLRHFYKAFFGIKDDLDNITKYGFNAMTANGDYKLTYDLYAMCFSNFLLGKTEYGPGKYIFGVFGHREYCETFKVNYGD